MNRERSQSATSIRQDIRKYVSVIIVPLILILLFLLLSLFYYNQQYTKQLNNVISASAFNQSFKETVDLKMYYYVTGSSYADGLPMDEVEAAEELAQNLLTTTTARESQKAISNVLELCSNLKSKMQLISETESYDERQNQLDSNIYILTSLIEEYMYNYLYYEAVELSQAQASIQQQIQLEMVLVILLSVLALALALYYSRRFGESLTRPIHDLCNRVREIGAGKLEKREPIPTEVDEIRILSNGFEQMVCQLHDLIETRQQEEERLRQTEFALLQAQINPHFLYNTLDTIIWLEEAGQTEQSIEMVTNLSHYFRTSLSNGRDIITLAEELSHVHSYLDIQQVRYHDIMHYELETQPELAEVQIPKLTLQPLVENALYHGIKRKRGGGCIRVSCRQDGDSVRITVSDDGAGMTPEQLAQLRKSLNGESRTGFGFVAVHERLRLLFGTPYGLSVDSVSGSYTTVTVLLPIHSGDQVQ